MSGGPLGNSFLQSTDGDLIKEEIPPLNIFEPTDMFGRSGIKKDHSHDYLSRDHAKFSDSVKINRRSWQQTRLISSRFSVLSCD
jgi:hypothetical protein